MVGATGDGSASTLWDNDDWWRLPENCGRDEPLYTNANYIRHLTPHARVLVILRQPTDRSVPMSSHTGRYTRPHTGQQVYKLYSMAWHS